MSTTVSRFSSLFALIANFEQYFQASILKTQNDLESFVITWKVFTPLKNNRLKLSVVSGLLNMLYGKKPKKTRKRRKSTDSFVKQRIPMASICNYWKTAIWYTNLIFASKMSKTTFKALLWFFIANLEQ